MDHFSGTDPVHPLRRMTAEVSALVKDAAGVDPVFMPDADKAPVLAELTALQDQLRLIELGVARTCGDLAAQGGHRDVASWRAATQQRDRRAAGREDRLAEALAERWTALAAAVSEGRVSLEQATVIVRALDVLAAALEDELAQVAEAASGPAEVADVDRSRDWVEDTLRRAEVHLIGLAADHTPLELARLGEGILTVVAPEHAEDLERRALERAERRARAKTRLTCRDRGDGSVRYSGVMPKAAWTMLKTYLDSLTAPRLASAAITTTSATGTTGAAGEGDKGRALVDPWIDPTTGRRIPHEQRWGQAFVALLERVTSRDLPQHGGLGAAVVVTIDLESLSEGVGHGAIGDPAGEGTRLSVGQVRRLACASGILPAVLGSDSSVLDLGRTSRLFNVPQRKAHAITHPTCEAVGCTVPAAWCESHHKRDPWAAGGTTNQADLGFLCAWHHHRAHDPGYRTTWSHDGARFNRRT